MLCLRPLCVCVCVCQALNALPKPSLQRHTQKKRPTHCTHHISRQPTTRTSTLCPSSSRTQNSEARARGTRAQLFLSFTPRMVVASRRTHRRLHHPSTSSPTAHHTFVFSHIKPPPQLPTPFSNTLEKCSSMRPTPASRVVDVVVGVDRHAASTGTGMWHGSGDEVDGCVRVYVCVGGWTGLLRRTCAHPNNKTTLEMRQARVKKIVRSNRPTEHGCSRRGWLGLLWRVCLCVCCGFCVHV